MIFDTKIEMIPKTTFVWQKTSRSMSSLVTSCSFRESEVMIRRLKKDVLTQLPSKRRRMEDSDSSLEGSCMVA